MVESRSQLHLARSSTHWHNIIAHVNLYLLRIWSILAKIGTEVELQVRKICGFEVLYISMKFQAMNRAKSCIRVIPYVCCFSEPGMYCIDQKV